MWGVSKHSSPHVGWAWKWLSRWQMATSIWYAPGLPTLAWPSEWKGRPGLLYQEDSAFPRYFLCPDLPTTGVAQDRQADVSIWMGLPSAARDHSVSNPNGPSDHRKGRWLGLVRSWKQNRVSTWMEGQERHCKEGSGQPSAFCLLIAEVAINPFLGTLLAGCDLTVLHTHNKYNISRRECCS